ncbi:MAG: hypothetical protein ACRC9L_01390 [Brevinema sp.]
MLKEHFDILLLSEDSTPLVDRLIPPHLKQQIRVIPGNGADINSLSARVESFRQEFPHKKILVHVDKDKQAKYINSKLNIWFTDYATIEGHFLKALVNTSVNAMVVRIVKEKIEDNKNTCIRRIYRDSRWKRLSDLESIINHVLEKADEESQYPKRLLK